MPIGNSGSHIKIYISDSCLNLIVIFGFCEFFVYVFFLTLSQTKCQFENSKITEKSVLCVWYMNAEVLYQQC